MPNLGMRKRRSRLFPIVSTGIREGFERSTNLDSQPFEYLFSGTLPVSRPKSTIGSHFLSPLESDTRFR
jgi:hypothetical protein